MIGDRKAEEDAERPRRNVLAAMGGAAAAVGRFSTAATLLGAAEARAEALQKPFPPEDQQEFERDTALVRSRLGAEEFQAALAAGRALPPEQADRLAYSVGEELAR